MTYLTRMTSDGSEACTCMWSNLSDTQIQNFRCRVVLVNGLTVMGLGFEVSLGEKDL